MKAIYQVYVQMTNVFYGASGHYPTVLANLLVSREDKEVDGKEVEDSPQARELSVFTISLLSG